MNEKMSKYKGLPLSELKRLKEVLEWQMSIAKCGSVIADKKQRLQEINQRIKNTKQNENTKSL